MPFISKKVYLDYASLTPTDPRVLREMALYYKNEYGNPSSIHADGVRAEKAVREARTRIAKTCFAHADEIIFTGSGTEANNLAVFGFIKKAVEQKKQSYSSFHIITSEIEHASLLEPIRELENQGVAVTYLPISNEGIVDIDALKDAIRPETVFVSIMYVNNEIGTIQPIREIAKILRDIRRKNDAQRIVFHTDASQAPAYLSVNVVELGVDMMTIDSHKVYGPKGIGMLYVKRGIELEPIILGGGQEKGLRSGTENVPAIMGFARAMEICGDEREKETKRILKLRDYALKSLNKKFSNITILGSLEKRIANNINISFGKNEQGDIDHEYVLLRLDAKGIRVATKSSCLRDEDESYVVKALAKSASFSPIRQSLRVSLGRWTKKSDINYFIKVLQGIL